MNAIIHESECNQQDKELLYHYCFNINDLELIRFGLNKNQQEIFRMLLLTMFGKEIAYKMNDNWLIVHGKDKHVIMYDKKNTNINEYQIMQYYITLEQIPEDILYLGEEGIELYSRNVKKIELHKAYLEMLSENIEGLIELLLMVENKYQNESQEFRIKSMEEIIETYLKNQKKEYVFK